MRTNEAVGEVERVQVILRVDARSINHIQTDITALMDDNNTGLDYSQLLDARNWLITARHAIGQAREILDAALIEYKGEKNP